MSARKNILPLLVLWTFTAVYAWGGQPPKVVFIAGEFEYGSKKTLPVFARELHERFEVETVVLERPEDPKQHTIPGLEKLQDADLLVLYVRRMTLPESELRQIKDYVNSGRPVVGIRTASHAFENWKEFDRQVLGGNYQNHHGNKLKTTISIVPSAVDHAILKRVSGFVSDGSLYKNSPLQPGAKPILIGKVDGFPEEPVAWTHEYKGARVFYTSLGHPKDFEVDSFNTLLMNGITWALGKPMTKKEGQ